MKNDTLTLHIVSHTHWDREWYQTFEGFRKRLVLMMDELLEKLESDPQYKHFVLDGQSIVLKDYLEIRPENEARLRKLLGSGKLIAGPWYLMPDEFLVSSESLIRNLVHGRSVTKGFGGNPMRCGYVVDIFGHNSQMPQILRGFGIDSAMLYRGIADYEKDTFIWEAKDGSAVMCANLDPDRSYSNFYFAIRWPFDGREYQADELVRRMEALLAYEKPRMVSNHLIMMDGVDHIEIEPELPKIIQTLRERMPNVNILHTTLDEYFSAQANAAPGLETLRGELYSCGRKGVNNVVLKNVLSSTVHLKQLNDECERSLTRWAEPFSAFAAGVTRGAMRGFIQKGWETLLQNHAHDSICGCSISRVHEDNLYRFNQAMDISKEVINHSLEAIAQNIRSSYKDAGYALVLFNPAQREFSGVAEVQVETLPDFSVNFEVVDADGAAVPYQITKAERNAAKGVFRFRLLPQFIRINRLTLALNVRIPAMGYTTLWLKEKPVRFPGAGEYTSSVYNPIVRYRGSMLTAHDIWENELLKVRLSTDGGLSVMDKANGKEYTNLLRFEDGGDFGDGWNYRKPHNDRMIYSDACNSEISVEADGPLLTRWRVRTHMHVPARPDTSELRRSEETTELLIDTLITLRAGSARLEFHTEVENRAIGHRLRVLFPTGLATEGYYASTPFALEHRSIHFADTSAFAEEETFVMPNQGFVALQCEDSIFALYNRGLYEAQVTEDTSRTVALTLFRSFPHEIGQDFCGVGRQLMKMEFDYALEFASGSVSPEEMLIRAEAWRAGIKAVTAPVAEGMLAPSQSFLELEAASTVITCVKQADNNPDILVVRLYNASETEEQAALKFNREIREAYLLDFEENVQAPIERYGNMLKVAAGRCKIMTVGVLFGNILHKQDERRQFHDACR